jgi:hypothetical protein
MPIGQRFKLKVSTLAASEMHRNGKLVLLTIPAGDIITVADASGDKMVTVLWEGRSLFMFADDLEQRATQVPQETAGSGSGAANARAMRARAR